MSNSTDETLQLTVMKNSPHIWAGGLESQHLALWLISKANALLWQVAHKEKLNAARESLINLELTEPLVKAYAGLGLSLKESDPIRPPGTEAIQFDMALANEFQRLVEPLKAGQMCPVEYSLLPDLHEEQEEYQKKKAHLFHQGASQCE